MKSTKTYFGSKVTISFKGQKARVVKLVSFCRNQNWREILTVYYTEDGRAILPAHFKYGLAEFGFGQTLNMVFDDEYLSFLADEIMRPHSWLDKLSAQFKDSHWHSGIYEVPAEVSGEERD